MLDKKPSKVAEVRISVGRLRRRNCAPAELRRRADSLYSMDTPEKVVNKIRFGCSMYPASHQRFYIQFQGSEEV